MGPNNGQPGKTILVALAVGDGGAKREREREVIVWCRGALFVVVVVVWGKHGA